MIGIVIRVLYNWSDTGQYTSKFLTWLSIDYRLFHMGIMANHFALVQLLFIQITTFKHTSKDPDYDLVLSQT